MQLLVRMTLTDAVGWGSSAVLLLAIGSQVVKQWRAGKADGVSPWLFVGQMAASTGFVVYSVSLKSWVFVVTNALMLLAAILGAAILVHHKRRARRPQRPRRPQSVRATSFLAPSATPQRSSLRYNVRRSNPST